ncbi:MAG TPA: TetR/AcrR family transcriptional regulator [Burkholderiaceae bacterium]|nr:TetR/AcrR family transcriptional regulator [Burkholderiaceae bacterium]
MARTRAATFEQQRDAMLAAAAQLFAERGYPAASIADLAAQIRVSKGLLYHYYRDKEHLLFDIAERYVDRLVQLTVEVEAAAPPPEAALRQLIECFMVAYEHAGAFHRVLVQDVKYLSAVHRTRVRAKQRQVIDAFARAIAAAAPDLASDRLLKPVTMTLFGMMNWTFTWLRPDGPVAHAELAPVVADLFLGGVRRLHAAGHARPRAKAASNRSGKVAELAR